MPSPPSLEPCQLRCKKRSMCAQNFQVFFRLNPQGIFCVLACCCVYSFFLNFIFVFLKCVLNSFFLIWQPSWVAMLSFCFSFVLSCVFVVMLACWLASLLARVLSVLLARFLACLPPCLLAVLRAFLVSFFLVCCRYFPVACLFALCLLPCLLARVFAFFCHSLLPIWVWMCCVRILLVLC